VSPLEPTKSFDSVESLASDSLPWGDSIYCTDDGLFDIWPPRIAIDRLNSVFSILLWNVLCSLKVLGTISTLVCSLATRIVFLDGDATQDLILITSPDFRPSFDRILSGVQNSKTREVQSVIVSTFQFGFSFSTAPFTKPGE